MTFLNPAMLWSLAVLAPLAAIYFLKVRPRRKPTTAYFLWERIFQEKRSTSLFHRLRDFWSLLLLLLAAGAVCLALARPEWTDERQDLLILIDTSASMGAKEGRTTRLQLAKRAAAEIALGLSGSQRAAVATVGRRLTYRSHLTDNPSELQDAIEAIQVADEPLVLDALPNQDDVTGWHREHRVLLITDGGLDQEKLAPQIELLKVGTPLENVGLVAADLSYLPGTAGRVGVYFEVASTYETDLELDLTLSHIGEDGGEQLLKVIPLRIEPGENRPEQFVLDNAPPGRWIARIECDDALAVDNVAYLTAIRPKPITISVESSDRFFFENSVLAFSRGEGLLQLVEEGPEVVLAKSATPDAELSILFQPSGESPWWSDLGDELAAGAPRVMEPGHPVVRHLDAASIGFVGSRQLNAPTGSQILVADDTGLPLLYVSRSEGRTAVVVNIDPVASQFYFSAWFPVLIHSAATHLVGRETTLASTYRPGDAAPIPGSREETITRISGPSGETAEARGKWFNGLDRVGFYQLTTDAGVWPVGSSLLSPQETLLEGRTAASTNRPISRGRSPVHWLTLLALVVVTTEAVLYHRRKVG